MDIGIGAASGVDEQPRGLPLRKADAGDACAVGDGERDFDSVGEAHGVVAGVCFFMRMIERLRVVAECGCGRGGQFAREWQDGDIAVERASGTAEMRHPEAVNLVLVVEVPAVIAGVGAPLHHAEGKRCAGECVAVPGGSDDGIDRVVSGLWVGGRREGEEQ